MNEIIQLAFSPVNMIFTFLLLLVVLYWLTVIIGVLDFGSLDIDFDMDVEADVDVDTEIQTGGAGAMAGALQFFNFGKLPFMIIISFVILFAWTINMVSTLYIGDSSVLLGLALLFPNLFVSLCFTKIVTTPLIPIFKNLDSGVDPIDYIGMSCKLLLPLSQGKMGQAEVIVEEMPLLLNVKLETDSIDQLQKGTQAVVLRKEKNKSYYIIKPTYD